MVASASIYSKGAHEMKKVWWADVRDAAIAAPGQRDVYLKNGILVRLVDQTGVPLESRLAAVLGSFAKDVTNGRATSSTLAVLVSATRHNNLCSMELPANDAATKELIQETGLLCIAVDPLMNLTKEDMGIILGPYVDAAGVLRLHESWAGRVLEIFAHGAMDDLLAYFKGATWLKAYDSGNGVVPI